MLMSSKGKSKYKLLFSLLGTALIILSIVFFCVFVVDAPSRLEDTGILLSSVIFVAGLVAILFAATRYNGYIDVYEDHVEGKGLLGKGMNNFYLTNEQIRSITQESYYLCLHTDAGIFKIVCDSDSRKAIMKHFTLKK